MTQTAVWLLGYPQVIRPLRADRAKAVAERTAALSLSEDVCGVLRRDLEAAQAEVGEEKKGWK